MIYQRNLKKIGFLSISSNSQLVTFSFNTGFNCKPLGICHLHFRVLRRSITPVRVNGKRRLGVLQGNATNSLNTTQDIAPKIRPAPSLILQAQAGIDAFDCLHWPSIGTCLQSALLQIFNTTSIPLLLHTCLCLAKRIRLCVWVCDQLHEE